MEKTIEVKIPDGYIFDKDNSTENIIRFKPIKKKITYQDVKEKLFPESHSSFYFGKEGAIVQTFNIKYLSKELLLATSQRQLQQIRALNKLMNVAKYLNGDWEPNWNDEFEDKIYFYYSYGKLNICAKRYSNFGCVCFKTIDLAHQAVEILGKEEVKKALGIFE